MLEILNTEDFDWYKQKLDVEGKYHHDHFGEPTKYPCKVVSKLVDENDRPYTFYHKFVYKVSSCCSQCGHKTSEYFVPPQDVEDFLYE